MSCTITVTEFKDLFDRGQFTYDETTPPVGGNVRDKDIQEAIEEAECVFNGDIYEDETCCKKALSYLTAHFLKLDVDAALGKGNAKYNRTSRSADGISEGLQLPPWVYEDEFLSMFTTTFYGQKWIMLSLPYMGGVVLSVKGATTP